MTNEYTFSFINNDKRVRVIHAITDEHLLGMGFGVFIYNREKHLKDDEESIVVDGGVNLVHEFQHDSLMYDGWTIDNNEDEPHDARYILKYQDTYASFNTAEFIQGINTVFLWLDSPQMLKFTKEVYDVGLRSKITVN